MTKTLSQYLKDANDQGIQDFRLKIYSTQPGAVQVYIHPCDKNGDTGDYFVIGNLAVPAIANGVIGSLEAAILADCEGFTDQMPDPVCPKCHSVFEDTYLQKPWFVATGGGVMPSTPSDPEQHWVEGVQTCSHCGHQFEVEGY